MALVHGHKYTEPNLSFGRAADDLVDGELDFWRRQFHGSPTFSAQPPGAIICAGTNVVLSASANGSGAVGYQWQLNRTNIAGQNQPIILLNNIQTIQQGHYRVIATDSQGSTASDEGLVVVLFPPTVVGRSGNLSLLPGQTATFSILATAKPPPTYQWRKNGVNIAGATTTTYTVASITGADGGVYDCVVSNACGVVTSPGSALEVQGPPVVVTDPVSQTVPLGTNVVFSVTATGSAPLLYQWCRNNVPITGATNRILTLSNVQFSDEAGYSAKVSNTFGQATSGTATLKIIGNPVIIVHPQSQAVLLGDSATFNVFATGRPVINYQWMKGGVDIPGATSTNLTVSNITVNDLMNYSARAFNIDGQAVSSNATLIIASRIVRVENVQTTNFSAGAQISIPVVLDADGGEHQIKFSLTYDTNCLVFAGVNNRVTGATASGSIANPAGILSLDWKHATGQSFTGGTTNNLFDVLFTVRAAVTSQKFVLLTIENSPTAKEMLGTSGQTLAGRFIGGSVVGPAIIFKKAGLTTLNAASGHTVETIFLIMPAVSSQTVAGPSLEFSALGNDSNGEAIVLVNATATNAAGNPIVIFPGTIGPGANEPVKIEYDVSDRVTVPVPNVGFNLSAVTSPTLPGGGVEVASASIFSTQIIDPPTGLNTTIIDFPSTAGQTYYIQYRDSATAAYTTSFPPVQSDATFTRWVDFGAPRTISVPTGARTYRVLEFQ